MGDGSLGVAAEKRVDGAHHCLLPALSCPDARRCSPDPSPTEITVGRVLEPIGPLPTRVYWLRRAAVVAVVLAVVGLLLWVTLGRSQADSTNTGATTPTTISGLTGDLATPTSESSTSSGPSATSSEQPTSDAVASSTDAAAQSSAQAQSTDT